ncbi:DUF5062 domain-containing protein [Vibrio sp. UCD-FRSSP16_10]|uniref:DUF5062 family protein n=1 Tax=unclassified Vibrio TaxID=2614977 RepID=UPI0007FE65C9|nr:MULTISPECIES: DUF5062 family protein [unclassified Vibrio]OBT08567.1 DUF5062 domain-containing protein [Vibrio sp. UCD-FRSSP16_30]OBT18097.1 DUF5062 domain-containing protein [Vibrio sp. UCD-FRSSP16_10]
MSKTAKIHNEDKLVKKAIEVGFKMAKLQGFDLPSSTQPLKVQSVYLFLVGVNQITPLPENKQDGPNIKKRLALWIHNALPDNDPLK